MPHQGQLNGAASELFVMVDLMRRGWEVYYRHPANSSCDLIAIQGPVLVRVQVKSRALQAIPLGDLGLPNLNVDPDDVHFDALAEIFWLDEPMVRFFPLKVRYTPEVSRWDWQFKRLPERPADLSQRVVDPYWADDEEEEENLDDSEEALDAADDDKAGCDGAGSK